MTITPVSLGLKSQPARYKQGGSAVIINGYAESADAEGKGKWPIFACDGLVDYVTLGGTGGVRAMYPVGAELVVVSGRLIHTVSNTGSSLIASDLATDGPVYMAGNGHQVGIVSGGIGVVGPRQARLLV